MQLEVGKRIEKVSEILTEAARIRAIDSGPPLVVQLSQVISAEAIFEETEDPVLFLAEFLVELLTELHEATKIDRKTRPELFSIALGDLQKVTALVDLLIIECVYPSLSPGVGIPLEKRVKNYSKRKSKNIKGNNLVLVIVEKTLLDIVEYDGDLGDVIMGGQYVTDIISILVELGYGPVYKLEKSLFYREKLVKFIDRLQTFSILTYFSILLSPNSPSWFMAVISRVLANIPLNRKDGVQSLIEFVGGLRDDDQISVEKLERAARIFCSVPKDCKPQTYFEIVGSQFLEIIDHPSQTILETACVEVVSHMYRLRPRVVIDFIFNPIISCFGTEKGKINTANAGVAIVTDIALSTALLRLARLVRGLAPDIYDQLLSPIALNLWALLCFQRQTRRSTEVVKNLIVVYIKFSDPVSRISLLIDNAFFSGAEWRFADGETGQVELRKTSHTYSELSRLNLEFGLDTVESVDIVDLRVELLLELFEHLDRAAMKTEFIKTLRRWLAKRKDSSEPLSLILDIRILEGILDKHKTELVKSPSEIIHLVSGILEDYIDSLEKSQRTETGPVSEILSHIVHSASDSDDEEDYGDANTKASSEAAVVALSLLTAVITESMIGSSKLSEQDQAIISSFGDSLKYIAQYGTKAVSTSASMLAILLDETEIPVDKSVSHLSQSQMKYQTALADLQDPLVPVRAQGLTVLRSLVQEKDSVINPDKVLQTYLSTLNDEDSFIYLNSIKGLQALTDIFGVRIIKKLVFEYCKDVLSLDERLRIGEALIRTTSRLGEALTAGTGDIIMSGLLDIVRTRENDTRLRASALSIMGMACEVNPLGVASWVKLGVECSLGILTFEKTEDKISLRRAAVVLLGSLLKGLNDLNQFPRDTAKDTVRTIRYIRTMDQDALVRVQCGNVLDILSDALTEKLNLG
ncbi:uncharacterized protein V1516DRAFT_648663 [Lipomyces oligophaga]|uniref:uncharacterized protein n=1 Tax=Lipomyces oligophaga TaxID=45792 RepID=UPI0034CD106F